jgi:hypothetical protein
MRQKPARSPSPNSLSRTRRPWLSSATSSVSPASAVAAWPSIWKASAGLPVSASRTKRAGGRKAGRAFGHGNESAAQRGLGNSRSIGQCVLMNGDLMTM